MKKSKKHYKEGCCKILYIFFSIVLAISAAMFFLRKSPVFFKWFLFLFMWMLFAGNYDNADYERYAFYYNSMISSGVFSLPQVYFEPGFLICMKLSAISGLSYSNFLFVISFVGLFLIAISVRKETSRPEFVYFFYLIYPFFFDIVQVRFFLATAVFVHALGYLTEGKKRCLVKYVIGVFLASSFHVSAFIYLPVGLFHRIGAKWIFLFSFAFSSIGIVLVSTKILPFLSLTGFRVEHYLKFSTNVGFYFYIFTQICLIYLVFTSRSMLARRGMCSCFVDTVFKINLFSIVFFPLLLVDSSFTRLYRMVLIPTYVVLSIAVVACRPKERFVFFVKSASVVFLIGSVMVWYINNRHVFAPIMEKNVFFDFL